MTLIESLAALLLLLGSALVFRAVWAADAAPTEPAQRTRRSPEEQPRLRRAA